MSDRLAQMIRIRTDSADLAATGKEPFKRFHRLLSELYPLVHGRLELEYIGDLGLVYRWPGRDHGSCVVLMAHHDTVPADPVDGWTHDPFSGDIADGMVWGRGAVDDKGALCVLFEAVENLLTADFVPSRDVYLVSGGDEEVSGNAVKAIAQEFRDRGIIPWLVLDEGGAIIDDAVPFTRIPSAMVGVAEKGNLTVRVTATGRTRHTSAPSSQESAIGNLVRAVNRLERRNPFRAHLPAATVDMFQRYRERTSGIGKAISTLVPLLPGLSARSFALMGPEASATVRTTSVTTMLAAGTDGHIIPTRAEAIVNLRIALGDTAPKALQKLKHTMRDFQLTYDVLKSSEPSPESRTDNLQWRLIAEAVENAYPGTVTVPYLSLGGTDARFFHPDVPDATYRLAPLSMTARQREAVHGIDEHVTIDALIRGEAFYRALITSL